MASTAVLLTGVFVMLGGIEVATSGVSKMLETVKNNPNEERMMFRVIDVVATTSKTPDRAIAINEYRAREPKGRFYKMFRLGQGLIAIGFFTMLAGLLVR